MRQLLPPPVGDGVDGPALYRTDVRPRPPGRPWVALNMVTSVDGATALAGRSGGLAGEADRQIFHALRSCADVILVGAATVRAEDYGPPRTSLDDQAARRARGQAPFPTIAVVSGRLALDPAARVFHHTPTRPMVLTAEHADPGRRSELGEVADVVDAGADRVDVGAALDALHRRGARLVLCEGGPTLNGELLDAGLVDEVCLTLSPLLVSGPSARLAHSASASPRGGPTGLVLARLLEEEGTLFARYVRAS